MTSVEFDLLFVKYIRTSTVVVYAEYCYCTEVLEYYGSTVPYSVLCTLGVPTCTEVLPY